jgi:predicted RNase H-like HicB family nuclease
MKYKVNLKKTEEGYAIWVPGLPGCWSQGKDEDEALENIKDAIEAYLATAEELGERKEVRYVEVAYV